MVKQHKFQRKRKRNDFILNNLLKSFHYIKNDFHFQKQQKKKINDFYLQNKG